MNKKSNNSASSTGMGLGGVLGVIFVVLKLVGVIDWSWLWVLSPFWISAAIVIVCLLIWLFTLLIIKKSL